ncbi:MAG: hypothetical protein ACE5H2_05640 [Terriglobia bacterium]
MRALSPEEIEHVRQNVLRPLRWTPVTLVVVGAVFLGMVLRGSFREDWTTLLVPLAFFGFPLVAAFRRKRQIEADLADGFAETLSGEVEKLWRSRQEPFIRVAGQSFRVQREVFRALAKGQPVTVDFLPRSRVAIKVVPGSWA